MSPPQKICSAEGCKARVGQHMRFCRRHWGQLTDRLRESLVQNYHRGAAVQSPAYRLDVSRAIHYLSQVAAWRAKQRKALGISSGRAAEAPMV